MNIKFFIGPMTKNVVDSVIEHCRDTGENIGFIPSRRQVSIDGGYVNNWSTKSFREYVGDHFVVRDHGGPGQGSVDDDGIESLIEDCKNFNLLHIDPWKKFSNYEGGMEKTVELIKLCHSCNDQVFFEVGTEESIRRFETVEIERLLSDLEQKLTTEEFSRIKYCVIQSGTSLRENCNTGAYDKNRLAQMCKIVKKYNLQSKEHNGDYLPTLLIKEKFSLGLDSINIAPEFGQIETRIYLQTIKSQKPDLINTFWEICYKSDKWKKWVDQDFDPVRDKEKLINICGHYVLSSDDFLSKIRNNIEITDAQIKEEIKDKLKELFNAL